MNRVALGTLLILALTVSSLHAQLVNDGATVTLADVTTNITGNVTVGTNGSFTLLVLSNNASVTNTLRGVIGQNATARSNEVRLTSPTARWQMGTTLAVGSTGAFNRLVISNGAQVVGTFAGNTAILGETAVSTNNFALVTGAGSLWSNAGSINIGSFGARNQLVISNGGRFHSENQSYIGLASSSTNNRVTVNGAGSVWSSDGGINLGLNGRGNALEVRGGGGVRDASGFIGEGSGGFNLADLAGPGTFWTNTSEFHVGSGSSGNQLTVSNGAVVFAGSLGLIGRASGASSNTVTVSDHGSMWVNGGDLYVGRDGPSNRLLVNNGGQVFVNGVGRIGASSGASNNSITVAMPGSGLTVGGDFYAGSNCAFNGIQIFTGASASVGGKTYIGFGASGRNNTLAVSDAGSVWTSQDDFLIGGGSGRDLLLVVNGGVARGLADGLVGMGGPLNEVIIRDPGSLWDLSAGTLSVGLTDSDNRVTVSDGGAIRSSSGELGLFSFGSNALVTVTDGGLWQLTGSLVVGVSGAGHRLSINNGGAVETSSGVFVGTGTSSARNRVTVDGGVLRATNAGLTAVLDVRRGTNVLNAGLIEADLLFLTSAQGFFEFNGGTLVTRAASILNDNPFTVGRAGSTPASWEVRGPGDHVIADGLTVGGGASFAQLIHTNGALLTNDGPGVLGGALASRSNSATVGGPGTRWWLSDGVVVGSSGSDNHLVVRDGASLVTASSSYLGQNITSTNNEAVVTGPGSSWFTANFGLRVGDQGRNNRLLVSDGGVLSSFDDAIGVNISSSNNLALVTGPGSLWNNTRELSVGLNSIGNQLVVSNGATVFTVANKYIGLNDGALANTALVTDPGSAWLGDDSLYVGLSGSLNRLIVRNGGRVTSGLAILGGSFGADGNLALVTDAGSVWSNRFDLNVGELGSANQLVVGNGGAILSGSDGFIGRDSGANSNAVLLTDAGTRWLLSSNLYVGSNGAFSRLVISNGARVENVTGIIGAGSSSSNNLAVVTGSGSVWSNASQLLIGAGGLRNQLVVSNGGVVISSGGILSGSTLSALSNLVVVTGPGSAWSNASSLTIGLGSGNRLVVSDGGVVRSSSGLVGTGGAATTRSW